MQRTLVGLAGVLLAITTAASGEVVNYTIDQAQSSLTVTGNLTSNFASQQTPGSTTTSFTGTIIADRFPALIKFTGGSSINAVPQASNQQPRNDATPGSQPADYGRTAPGPFGSTSLEAIRDLFLDVEDDTSGAGIPISSNNFASSSLVLVIDSGESDVLYGSTPNEIDLTNKATANSNGNGLSSVVVSGSTETLTLKFSTGSIGYNVAQAGDSSLAFTGTIVATRLIPEPAGAGLIGLFAGALVARRRRQ